MFYIVGWQIVLAEDIVSMVQVKEHVKYSHSYHQYDINKYQIEGSNV